MNRSFFITLIATIVVCIAILWTQAVRNKILAQSLAEAQIELSPESRKKQTNSKASNQGQSTQRIDLAFAKVEELKPGEIGILERKKTYNEAFPEFLRSIEGLTFDELIAVAEKTSDSQFKRWMILLATEQDPLRVSQNEELRGGLSVTQLAEALAGVDPVAALQLLPPLKPRDPEESSIYLISEPRLNSWITVATKVLGSDLELGLQTFLEIQNNLSTIGKDIPLGKYGSIGIPSLPEGSVPGVIKAMSDPQYSEIREDLLQLTLAHLMFQGGVPEVIQHAKSMGLAPAELKRSVQRVVDLGGLSSDPEQLLGWISAVRPEEIPSTIVKWADKNLPAATDWLDQQEPSPMRDRAIAQFTTKAVRIDEKAARAWANEIEDATLRTKTLQRIGN